MSLQPVVEVHDGKAVGAFTSQAKNVAYGNQSVEDALDELTANTLGTGIDITAYNSSANQYTFPSDGYVELRAAYGGTTRITFIFNGIAASANYSGGDTYNAFFVRKGMKGYVYENLNNGIARFIPFN